MRRTVLEFWKRKGLWPHRGDTQHAENGSTGPHPTPGPPHMPKRRLLLERLEERLLFDAGPQAPSDVDLQMANEQSMQASSIVEVLDARLIEPTETRPAMTTTDAATNGTSDLGQEVCLPSSEQCVVPALDPNAVAEPIVGTPLNADAVAAELLTTADEQRTELRAATTHLRHELVFVDTSLVDYETLVEDFRQHGDESRQIEIVLIGTGEDGLAKIGEVLQSVGEVDAIHLVTHGTESAVKLGSSWLNSESLHSRAGELAKWALSLSPDADLLIYGCNLASSTEGQLLLEGLSTVTGADVAASNDPTGNSQLGGDWTLETTTGAIETSSMSAPEWMGVLAPLDFVQSYFVPLPDTNIRTAYTALGATTSAQINSVISIATSSNNTVLVYDHWEDGYEADLANPTQSTTQIWGDGNLANGAAPGFGSDIIGSGGVVALQNLVNLPRNPATILFDGSDRIGSTKSIAVTRAAWATTPGSVLGTAVDVYDTSKYGTTFKVPIGQNTPNMNSMFEYVSLFVQAAQNGTIIQIDKNGDGSVDITQTLNMGETYQVNGGIMQGASLTSNNVVQAQLMTGDVGGTYESRSFTLAPTDQWSGSYYNPVSTTLATAPLAVFLYNPGTAPITVNYATLASSGSLTIAANGSSRFEMPMNSGAHFFSSGGEPFYAVGTMDSDATNHAAHDWGFRLIAEDNLTTAAVAGWAPGSSNLTVNGSPLWATAVNATRIYVDFDGNSATGTLTDPNGNKYDQHFDVSALQSIRIYDNADKNQTGTKIYTTDGTLITAAWGQDPSVAQPGNPYLDMGTAVLPLPASSISKTAILLNDLDSSGTVTPGDEIQYSITTTNDGVVPLGSVVVTDIVPLGTTYIAGSTSLNGSPVADQSGTTSDFPLDDLNNGTDEGLAIGNIPVGSSSTVSFTVVINDPYDGSPIGIVNAAHVDTDEATLVVSVTTTFDATPGIVVFATASGSGTEAPSYQQDGTAYLTVTDPDPNLDSAVAETITVMVQNPTTGDRETVTLTETGANTGVFSAALPTSISGGQVVDDGTIYALAGQTLTVSYTDPRYLTDTDTDTVVIATMSVVKQLYLSTDGSGSPDQDLDRVDPVNTADGTTATSVTLSTASSTITQVANTGTSDTDTSDNATANVVTFSHTAGSGANRLVLVGIAVGNVGTSGDPPTVTAATFGGTALTLVGTQRSAGATGGSEANVRMYLYQMLDSQIPGTGSLPVSVTLSGAGSIAVQAVTYTGANQTTPLGTFTSTNGANPPVAMNVSSATGELVFSVFAVDGSGSINSVTVGAGQTTVFNTAVSTGLAAAASTEPGATTVATNYSDSLNQDYALGAVAIKPAPGTGTTTTTFTQTLSMASDLVMPAGGTINVVTYVNVASGSMPTNPNITATLKYGSTTFATITNPVYDSGTGTLTWTTTLGSGVTIPSGTTVSLEVTTAQTGVTFSIDYDSASKPSRIDLPTTIFIDVTSVGVYDAPFINDGNSANDGTTITSTFNGQTVYVRALVTDPFGSADITSELLTITPPSGSSFTLAPTTIIPTGTLNQKIYEYAWATSVTQGNFAITVQANEGYEATIFDTAGTTFVVAALDLGTPSVTEFVDGSGTPVTEYLPDSTADIRITDIDQNADSAVIETLTATVTTSTGDTQTTTFTETGVNTGVFAASLPITSTGPANLENGTLYAPDGSTLFVSYTDPDDATDQSNDTALVLSTPPPPNNSPTAVDDTGTTDEGTTLNVSASGVLSNDSDPDVGQTLSVVTLNGSATAIGTQVTLPSGALLTLNADGSYSYAPNNIYDYLAVGQTATDSFDYALSDGNGGFASATVTITITGVNNPPDSTPISDQSNVDSEVIALNVAGSFTDGDSGDTLAFTATGLPTGLSINPITGLISGTINSSASQGGPGNDGVYTVEVTATDLEGAITSQTFTWAVTNPVPDARDNTYSTGENSLSSGNVLTDNDGTAGLDSDSDDDTLTVVAVNGDPGNVATNVTGSNGGAFTIAADGSYSFDPETAFDDLAVGQTRNTTVTYTLSDGNGGTDIATVTVSVTGVNDAPTGGDDTETTPEDTDYAFNVADFPFSDVDGGSLSAVRIDTLPVEGTLLFNGVAVSANDVIDIADIASGLLVFRPDANETGSPYTTFEFSVGDGLTFDVASNTMTLIVTPVNDPPIADDESVTTDEDTPVIIDVVNGDVDLDGTIDPTSVIIISTPPGATLSPDGKTLTVPGEGMWSVDLISGEITFTPELNYNGSVTTITYQVADNLGATDTADVSVTLMPVNDPPIADDENVTTDEDTPIVIDVVNGDTDLDGTIDPTSVIITSTPPGATLSPDNKTLTVPGEGVWSVDLVSGEITFTPELNYNGSVTTITYQVADNLGVTDTADVSVTLSPVNDPPIADDEIVPTAEDTPVIIDVVNGDIDLDGTIDPTSVIITSTPPGATLSPDGKLLTVPGEGVWSVDLVSGEITFTPELNYYGSVTTITYQVADNLGATDTADVSVTLSPVNDAPTGADNTVTTLEDTDFEFNVADFPFNDIDGDPLVGVRIDSLPLNGTLLFNGNPVSVNDVIDVADIAVGLLVLRPTADETGSPYTTFDFSGGDGLLFSTTSNSMTVIVTPVNDPPVADDESVTTDEDLPIVIDVVNGDVDLDGTIDPTSVIITSTPPGATLSADGKTLTVPGEGVWSVDLVSGEITFTPELNYNGSVTTITYQVADNLGATDMADVSVSLTPVNDAPTGADNTVTTAEDTDFVFSISDFPFNDIDGDPLAEVRIDTLPIDGTLLLNGNLVSANDVIDIADIAVGLFVFRPDTDEIGSPYTTFEFSVGDGLTFDVASNTMTVNVTPTTVSVTKSLFDSSDPNTVGTNVTIGEELCFSLLVTISEGNSTDLILTDLLPDGLLYDSWTLVTNAAASNGLLAADFNGSIFAPSITGGTVDGEDVVFTFGAITVTTDSDVTNNSFVLLIHAFVSDISSNHDPLPSTPTLTNTAAADVSNPQPPVSSNPFDVTVIEPDLSVTIDNGVATLSTGQTTTYSITITNDGDSLATGVLLSGSLPLDRVTFVSSDDAANFSIDSSGNFTWIPAVASLAPSGTLTLLLTVQINSSLTAGINDVTIAASVTHDNVEPTPANNTEADTDTLDAAPDLQLTKTDFSSSTTPGTGSVYTIDITNVGTQAATNVLVTESVPIGTTYNAALSDPLWMLIAPDTYEISLPTLASGASFSANFAVTVNSPAMSGQTEIVNTVTTSDDGTNGSDPNPGDNSATDTNTLVSSPDYQITINDGETVAVPGQPLSYSISFTNVGDQDGTGIVVSDTFPIAILEDVVASDGGIVDTVAGTITWNVGDLTVGDLRTFTVTAKVRDTVPAGFDNFTHDTSITDDLTNGADSTPTNNSTADTDVLAATPDYHIAITDGETAVMPGQSLSYTISFLNAGLQDGAGVVVSDTFPPEILENVVASDGGIVDTVTGTITWNVGDLAAGESRSFTVTAKVRDTIPAGWDDFTHSTTITDDVTNGTDPTPADNAAADNDTLNATPDYEISIDDGQTSATTGQTLTYQITFTNTGNQDGTGVVISDSFPKQILHNVVASDGGIVDETSGSIIWNVGDVTAGALLTLTVTADVWSIVPPGWDNFTHDTIITDDGLNGADLTPANNVASDTDTLDAAPDLRLTKTDFVTSISPGQGVVYSLTKQNVGNQDATNVIITETVPVGTTFYAALSNPLWVDLGGGVYQITEAVIPAGFSGNFDFAVLIDNPAVAGQESIDNTATIADDGTNGSDPVPSDNTAGDTDTLTASPDYEITIDDGQSTVVPGQSLTYTINFTNAGNQQGTGVVVINSFPTTVLENVVASDGGLIDLVGGTIAWNVGNLNVGETRSFTVTSKVRDTVPAGFDTLIHNTSITDDLSNGVDPNPANNSADDTDTLDATPDYQIDIDDGQSSVTPGQSLTYSITFTNVGLQDGTGVVVSDNYPIAILENVVASDGGIVDTFNGTITWNVGNLAVGESRTFTVTSKVRDTVPAGYDSFMHDTQIHDDYANGADPTPGSDVDYDVDILDSAPDLQFTKTDGRTTILPGDATVYTLSYANVGNQDSTLAELIEEMPYGTSFDALNSSPGWVLAGGNTYRFAIGDLAAGVSGSVLIAVLVDTPASAGRDDIINSAYIIDDTHNGTDPNPNNNSFTDTDELLAAPDYSVTIDDGVTQAATGQSLDYAISFNNVGTQAGTGVIVSSTFPLDVRQNVIATGGGVVDLVAGTITWNVGDLAVGDSGTYHVFVDVKNGIPAGIDNFTQFVVIEDDHTNGADPTPLDNSAQDTDTLNAAPDYSITINDDRTNVAPGETLTYTIVVTNIGDQGGTGVLVSDSFPPEILHNVVASDGGAVDDVTGTITWSLGSLGFGQSLTLTVTTDVRAVLPAGADTLTLNATVDDDHANGVDSTPANNSAADTDMLDAAPDYEITIDDGQSQVRPGDTLTYQVTVANRGTQDGTGVVISDLFPPGILQDVIASDGGVVDSVAGTITWSVGNLSANGSTSFTVTAKVRLVIDPNTKEFTHSTSVTDDLTNGSDPTSGNNLAADTDALLVYSYDSFHDWFEPRFAAFFPQASQVGHALSPLPVDPIFSGLTEPGTNLVGRIYDAQGRMMGERQVVADSGGNWLMTFPNVLIFEHPHRMEIIVTPAISNSAHENGFNLRRYFHPAIHTELYCNEQMSVSGVFRNRAYNIIDAMHSANTRPLGFDWFSHAYELNPASTNVAYQ